MTARLNEQATQIQKVSERRTSMNDQLQAKNLIENGKRHIAEESWD